MDKEQLNEQEEMEIEPVNIIETPVEIPAANTGETKKAPKEAEKTAATGNKRILQGKVTSNKAEKTIVVEIERQIAHPLYKKYYKKVKKVMAHDENNDCNMGDVVKVIESRPLSARKRWNLVEIVERAK